MQVPVITEPAVSQVTFVDPTGHVHTDSRQVSRRLDRIEGSVAVLLDNGNDTSNFFFQGLSEVLTQEYGVSQIILETKFTSTKPADLDAIKELSDRADFMVAGVCL